MSELPIMGITTEFHLDHLVKVLEELKVNVKCVWEPFSELWMVINLVGDEKLENRTADATYIRKVAQDFHPLLDSELGTPQTALMV